MKYYLSKLEQGADLNLMKASLLQKLIRRGMVSEALYIGEMYLKANQSKGLRRRLEIICAEDIGFGWLGSSKFMNETEDLLLIIQNLCLAPKNRESDIFLLTVANNLKTLKDKEKQIIYEAKVLMRLFALSTDWFNSKSKESLETLRKAFITMSENQKYGEIIQILGEKYISLTKSKVHGARCQMALAALIFARKWDREESFTPKLSLEYKIQEFDEIFDFAIDMHTPIGKKLGLDFDHWIKNCTLVVPEIKYPELFDSHGNLKYPLTKDLK